MKQNILVLGANGFLGLNLVERLIAEGIVPRCGRRLRSNVLALRKLGVPLAVADLDDPYSLERAMRGCDVVVHCAGHYPRFSLDPAGTLAHGLAQTWRVLDAAARADVRRLVYVSSTATVAPAPDGGPSDESHRFARLPHFGVYHDLKWTMEQAVLGEDRFEVAVACPAACIGPWDLRVGTSALLVATARGLDPPHPDGLVEIVDARDVAEGLARLATMPSPPRRVLLAGGGHRLHELLQTIARRHGAPPPSPPLDDEDAIRLANAEERRAALEGGRPAIAREIVDLVIHGVPIDAGLARRALGLTFRPLDETLGAFDAWARRMHFLPPIQELAP